MPKVGNHVLILLGGGGGGSTSKNPKKNKKPKPKRGSADNVGFFWVFSEPFILFPQKCPIKTQKNPKTISRSL